MTTTSAFEVEDIFEVFDRGVIITGKLLSGTICPGMTAVINAHLVSIGGLEVFRKKMNIVRSSDLEAKAVGIILTNVLKQDIEEFLKANRIVTFSSTSDSEKFLLSPPPATTMATPLKDRVIVMSIIVGLLILGGYVFMLLAK